MQAVQLIQCRGSPFMLPSTSPILLCCFFAEVKLLSKSLLTQGSVFHQSYFIKCTRFEAKVSVR